MRKWDTLLNANRLRDTNKNPKDERSEFQRDYDRIVFCSSFRRLQDKAQVYPLEKYDYVRTRLTHSLEASSLGRSFGTDVAKKLLSENKVKEDYTEKFSNILSSVALVHDLGNPPFGHCGEKIIQSWFKVWMKNNSDKLHNFSPTQKLDFIEFEGNAQAFRILTKLQFLKDQYGLNLTIASLASLIKYPCASDQAFVIEDEVKEKITTKKKPKAQYKKFGYFESEKEQFDIINKATGLNGLRHPLAYLLEASDDIAYSAADIEDGHKKKSINFELILTKFKDLLGDSHQLIKDFESAHHESIDSKYPDPEDLTMQKIRIQIQSKLMRDCIDTFVNNYTSIMSGEYKESLINGNQESKKIFKLLTEDIGVNHIYNDSEVLSLELVGNKVISGLLDIFVPAAISNEFDDLKSILGKYYYFISPNFKFIMNSYTEGNTYNKLQLVTDFICGMTDFYALDLYQKLSGFKLI